MKAAIIVAFAVSIGTISASAVSADRAPVAWMTGINQHVLSDEALESYRLIRDQCRKPHVRLCQLAIKNAIEFTQGGLKWMDANPAPTCLQPAESAMRKWLESVLEAKQTFLAGSEQGDLNKMQRGVELMGKIAGERGNDEVLTALDRASC